MRLGGNFIPARFLILIAHLVLTVTIFWSRTRNVEASLPLSYTTDQYNAKDTEFIVALSLTMVFFAIEFVGFIGGISMFSSTQTLLSIAAHTGGAVALAFFIFDVWSSTLYWWIFGFCSALPAISELFVIIGVAGLKKGF